MSEQKFNPDAVRNPSSGLFARNPTHIAEAQRADDQSDIVKAIKDVGVKRMVVSYNYADVDSRNPIPLMGILKIREMSTESVVRFCQNLMRSRPNIFKVQIKLGNYPNARRIENAKTRALNSSKPRFFTEVGKYMGEVLADKTMHVTEIKYVVHNADPGYFSATAEVYGVTEEEYEDNQYFSPQIEFEFIKTT